MAILAAVGAGLWLLYAWLSGWWFARWVVFVAIVALACMFSVDTEWRGWNVVPWTVAAWFIAGGPTYYARRVTRTTADFADAATPYHVPPVPHSRGVRIALPDRF